MDQQVNLSVGRLYSVSVLGTAPAITPWEDSFGLSTNSRFQKGVRGKKPDLAMLTLYTAPATAFLKRLSCQVVFFILLFCTCPHF